MTANERKGYLIIANCKLVDIADICNVTEQAVGNVIHNKGTSDRIQRAIADKIGRPVEEVFPERYKPRAVSPRRERKRQEAVGQN